MAGFFGLFRNKAKYIEEVTEEDRQSAQASESFFLDANEAKTIGKNNSQSPKETTSQQILPKQTKKSEPENANRRMPDKNMDGFRKMACDMKK